MNVTRCRVNVKRFFEIFFGAGMFPRRGKNFSAAPLGRCFSAGRVVEYRRQGGGELAARAEVSTPGELVRAGPRRFTCSAGRGAVAGTRRCPCTRQRVARAGAVRPPVPAEQAIRLLSAWSCSPPLSGRRGRRFAGRLPCGFRLPRMIAAIFCAVNRPKSVPCFPFRGKRGSFFVQISGVDFCANRCVWGIIGGIIA